MKNNDEILKEAEKLKQDFEIHSETEEDVLNEKMSFLDRLNSLVRVVLNDNTVSIYDALSEDHLQEWNKRKNSNLNRIKQFVANNFKNSLYFLLLATITCFLVSEALGFYAIDGIITTKTYVKAILTEICFIFLSGYRTKTKAGLAWLGVLRAGIFSLMVFAISSQVILQGTKEIGNTKSIEQQIVFIEKQITEKEKDIKYFKEIGYPRNATRVTIEKQGLVKKLIELKEQQAKGSNQQVSKIVEYKMYGKAFFRILLLFISVLITRRLYSF
jgi:outer membrane lipoprotein-sorting protein